MDKWIDEGGPPDIPMWREPFGTSSPTSNSVACSGALAPDRSSWLKSIKNRKPLGVDVWEGASVKATVAWQQRTVAGLSVAEARCMLITATLQHYV
eukprot:366227-Chlamydomonas_euryale.AAC.25